MLMTVGQHIDINNLVLQDPTHSWSGGLDAQLKTHDLNTDQGKFATSLGQVNGRPRPIPIFPYSNQEQFVI